MRRYPLVHGGSHADACKVVPTSPGRGGRQLIERGAVLADKGRGQRCKAKSLTCYLKGQAEFNRLLQVNSLN